MGTVLFKEPSPGQHLFNSLMDALMAGADRFLRTDQDAQMAADASFAVEHRFAIVRQMDRLMSAVGAGDLAAAASNALFPVKLRENDGIAFQNIGRLADGVHAEPDRLTHVRKTLLG